jgi:hypothetical protein
LGRILARYCTFSTTPQIFFATYGTSCLLIHFDIYIVIQDEAGTAAIKTVELDTMLGGRAIQYREPQGYESDKFLSYFKPCIIPLEGGFASGFKKPEEEKFETRLYICKGKRSIRVKEVHCCLIFLPSNMFNELFMSILDIQPNTP